MSLKNYLEFLMGQEDKVEKHIPVSGGVILRNNEEGGSSVLLIRRSPTDKWKLTYEFPRGKCDKGDSKNLIACLKREVFEETGLKVKVLKYIDKYEYLADEGRRKSTQHNFLCKMDPPNQKVKLSKEHDKYRWVSSVGEVELLCPPEMKKTISKVLNTDNDIVSYDSSKKQKIEE